jgi:predicted secreted protein
MIRHRRHTGRGLIAAVVTLAAMCGARREALSAPWRQQAVARDSSGPRAGHLRVTEAAVWHPTEAVVKGIQSECAAAAAAQYGQCFIKGMQEKGAPPGAVEFARTLDATGHGGAGFVEDFTEGGPVAVAHVVFPGRKFSREGWLLVNGSPSPIDVDDLTLLPLQDVKSDMIFQEIRRTFSKATVFSESRQQPSPPLVPRAGEAQEFLVNYQLLDGCATCKRVGSVQFAFDFTSSARFEGASLRGVWMSPDQGSLAPVGMDKDFHIHLVADHDAGYKWQLASPLDERFVSLVSTTYAAHAGQAGNIGVEDWTFHPRAPGRTIIRFQKVRPGETNPPRDRRFFFVVTVR